VTFLRSYLKGYDFRNCKGTEKLQALSHKLQGGYSEIRTHCKGSYPELAPCSLRLKSYIYPRNYLKMINPLKRPVRVLVAKVGLDGHDRGAKVIAAALRDAGMEVIYTGLRQTPEMVVNAALQEDVDAIGISILSGAHMTVFPRIMNLMKEKGMDDVLLTGGGIIPDSDMQALQQMGVGRLFPPGTNTQEIAGYITTWVGEHRSF
jgi:methylmalonyl-CoA mutase C-terminal domain/subunit